VVRPTRHDQLLDAAAALFAQNGFAATSVREIAAQANLTKAGLYYHIREKEDLLAKICAFSIDRILDGARQAVAEASDPRARIAALIRNHTGFFFQHPDNLVVLNRDRGALPPEARARISALERAYLDLIRETIRDGQATAAFRRTDPTVAAFTVLAALNTLDRWYDAGGPVSPEALVAEIETILCDGLEQPAFIRTQ